MASIESRFNVKQREDLETVRKMMGLRSRAAVIFWFADHAIEIVKGQLPPLVLRHEKPAGAAQRSV